ncbi:uncharacterized protein Z519_09552 [Cladophialophora bantiana CBS 173.52]|uniref:Uncharacterized protein n=1 Tax=Cladophialophora bantiana (strain ATCC 10958 / CBS 173.52 / CDC B-1940 / NIH 8579) TaxID=1442370 RepID=A0A0D2EJA1_CLAB1|nr:uncharacterized protein Z519_09552 [Cladophialophora bantiana CBS 173.52]KIW90121.1 hypothetical protein Z519_09552 [Cladophialophora bantiana CBS 173.52]
MITPVNSYKPSGPPPLLGELEPSHELIYGVSDERISVAAWPILPHSSYDIPTLTVYLEMQTLTYVTFRNEV